MDVQVFGPPLEPRAGGTGPADGRGGEEGAPVLDGAFEGENFGAWLASEEEGLFVGSFKDVGICGEESPQRGNVGLLLWEGVGAGRSWSSFSPRRFVKRTFVTGEGLPHPYPAFHEGCTCEFSYSWGTELGKHSEEGGLVKLDADFLQVAHRAFHTNVIVFVCRI